MSRPLLTTGTFAFMEVTLQWLNVYRRRSFFALLDVKANSLTLVKRLEAFALNGAEMYKDIPALIIFDKAKPFLLVEPFYLTFCQSFAPPFPKLCSSGFHIPKDKKTTPSQNRVLKRWWLDCPARYKHPTFPVPPFQSSLEPGVCAALRAVVCP